MNNSLTNNHLTNNHLTYNHLVNKHWLFTLAVLLVLPACGGGGGGSSRGAPAPVAANTWTKGEFQSADNFANRCETPRTGTSDQPGTAQDERHFLRSWSNEFYLWYDEIVDRDPANYQTSAYFDLLKTEAVTPSGNPKDRFHFSMPTAEWQSLSQSGVSVGYGITWSLIRATEPRELAVAYVEPGSPAAGASVSRGVRVVAIDGVAVRDGDDVDTLNAGLLPSSAGESHTFVLRELDGSERTATLSASNVISSPVTEVTTLAGGEVGYLLFNDHIATAETGLKNAIEQLQAHNIQDLVVDLRYNGGGYLAIASQLAYMIAGPGVIKGRTFETLTHNDKNSTENTPLPFYDQTLGFSESEGQPLPTLDLSRVYVLTGPDTCSASESIINGLRGVGVEVIQIGSTTCGKPYGFYPQDNCGTTYFSIQFRGENAAGFGDYPDGFSPQDTVGTVGITTPGCNVADDYTKALGDPGEARLAAALYYRDHPNDPCSKPEGVSQHKAGSPQTAASTLSAIDGRVIKSPALQGRIMQR